ncbi:branched-chain amino acid ABC transporter permease [Diaphorobacter caeni]|uniref:branched-chain amino acid ABC transporter permease n=1 Tax=Diaphorobacter caeni TaxID=2784387 RepID=UPI00188DD96B|nr:branched-chain amino acid ABC transporter permease [Diaphorobacter caeni]MBF5005772.1 branched-chain amino acid ABC transporter permease [Diaphorobacter caeni]
MDMIISGVLLGGLYGLFALGLSLMFGVMRLTNTAHGDFMVLAAYAVLSFASLGLPAWLALVATLPLAWLLGYALQRNVLNGVLGKDPLPSLVVTFGMSVFIQNLLLQVFSADPRSVDTGAFATESFTLGADMSIGVLPLLILALAVGCTAGLQWMFRATDLGRSFRAVSDDREIAELMGLNARTVYSLATALAFVLVALAGGLQSMRTTVAPTDGPLLLLFAFEAVIIGGMGSFWGTLAGAMLLGIVQQIGFRIDPGWGIWAGHLMFLLVLAVRPQGLFPKTR